MTTIHIAIITYPKALRSAVYGLYDLLQLSNEIASEGKEQVFSIDILDAENGVSELKNDQKYSAVLIPPSAQSGFNEPTNEQLKHWLQHKYSEGAILCSVCAGAFLLAETGLLNRREVTTHWCFGESLRQRFPQVLVNTDKILINDGDIITAGGMMSWVDLGLELVAQFMSPSMMRQLGKILVVDTGVREQRYYQSFVPKMDHGDHVIVKAQQLLQAHYHKRLSIAELSQAVHLTERTFLRRFVIATGFKPSEYLQQLRIQKACSLLEDTNLTFNKIAHQVGYSDASACYRVFSKITGLAPTEFRQRFA